MPSNRKERNRRMGIIREHQKNPGYYIQEPERFFSIPHAVVYFGLGFLVARFLEIVL